MSHEDWDLFAIVRSCKATNFTTPSTTTTQTPPTNTRSPHQNTTKLEPLQPNIVQPKTNGFLELHQLLVNNFNPTTTTTTTTITTTSTSGCGINPYSTTFSDLTGVQHKMQQQGLTNFTSFGASTTSFDRFHHQQQQKPQPTEQHQQQQQEAINQQPLQVIPQTNYMVLQNTQPQTPRSRKRKSQQKKMVCHVTADNLSADLWAWRKYGQKPIKGSPYPRNYYRCSSSKGCAARKQVERSTTDPNMFIVTYTGDHKHAKPVHRNSLAGSTRNKPSMTHLPAATETGSPQNAGSSSSTVLRPGSPENGEPECPDPDLRPDGDDVLIPNMAFVSDAFLLGLNHFDSDAKPSDGSDPNSVPGFDPNILSGPGLQEV